MHDLHVMLTQAGDWVQQGGADEQKPVKDARQVTATVITPNHIGHSKTRRRCFG